MFFGQRALYSFVADRSQGVTKELVRQVNYRTDHYIQTLNELAASPLVANAFQTLRQTNGREDGQASIQMHQKLTDILPTVASSNGFEDIVLLNNKGIVLYATDDETHTTIGSKAVSPVLVEAYRRAETSDDKSFVIEDVEKNETHYSLMLAHAFRDGRELQGVLIIHVPMNDFQNIFDSVKSLGSTAEGFAVIDEGKSAKIITAVSTQDETRLRIPYNDQRGLGSQKAAQGETGAGSTIDYLGGNSISSWSYVSSMKIGIVSKISLAEGLTAAKTASLPIALAVVALFVVDGVLFFWFFNRSLSSPLQHLSEVARQVADGQAADHVDHDLLHRHDEIGKIADSIHSLSRAAQHGPSAAANATQENPDPISPDHYHGK